MLERAERCVVLMQGLWRQVALHQESPGREAGEWCMVGRYLGSEKSQVVGERGGGCDHLGRRAGGGDREKGMGLRSVLLRTSYLCVSL